MHSTSNANAASDAIVVDRTYLNDESKPDSENSIDFIHGTGNVPVQIPCSEVEQQEKRSEVITSDTTTVDMTHLNNKPAIGLERNSTIILLNSADGDTICLTTVTATRRVANQETVRSYPTVISTTREHYFCNDSLAAQRSPRTRRALAA